MTYPVVSASRVKTGLMMERQACQPFQIKESHAQRKRSAGLSFGRFDRALEYAELMT
jgi:hypothetical protein